MRKRMLSLVAAAGLAGWAGGALADPILECGLMTDGEADLHQCLSGQLEVSYGAMNEALAMARDDAQAWDEAHGANAAVLGTEASQQAWEAYRDTECQTRALFAGERAESFQLACQIALTRARTDALLHPSAPRG